MIYTYSYHILPLIGSLLVFYAFEHGFFKKVWPILSYMGKKTLPIYILHILFVIQINEIGDFILNQNVVTSMTMQIIYTVTISTIAIILSLMLYKVICISNFFKRVLFGEY